ncbi:hypothetical protein PT974_01485 [Cladobotryum mycophilum]|uniref:Uncharacterized protein n=1 Tax=Cladobotryum mycophilum TaxID=491253 RepID=A0ABR0T428_9HYPO
MPSQQSADVASINIIDSDHRQPFERALMRILQTEIAEHTYAEILDGLPTEQSYREFSYPLQGHPSLSHTQLCPGVREKACEFRSGFDITSLRFSIPLLLAFQGTALGSRSFHLRLIELLAVSCHQIAVHLYQLDEAIHKQEEYETWRDEPRDMTKWDSYRAITAFSHGPYVAIEQYPNGLADAVGYWAEARIFGGVFVFDRGESETECRDVYIHGCRVKRGVVTIYPPTAEQFDHLTTFLLDERAEHDPAADCPFPILATLQNRWRWDPWDAISRFHIFRDKYERKVSSTKPKPSWSRVSDWPELGDDLWIINALWERREGKDVSQDEIDAAKERIMQITPSSPLWGNGQPRTYDAYTAS